LIKKSSMKKIFSLFLSLLLFGCLSAQTELDTTTMFGMSFLKTINTGYHEGAPVVSPDGNTIYFFVTNHPQNRYGDKGTQDIWYATRGENGEWKKRQHASNTLNKSKSNQVMAVVKDGNALLISSSPSKNERGLAVSHKKEGDWSKPHQLHIDGLGEMAVGSYYGASMTNDMKVILHYFSETKDAKKSDIYVSFQKGHYHYSKPVKIHISSEADEFGPFICSDDNTMYFSSDRKGGFGQADIYVTKRKDDSWLEWTTPKNIGKPANTAKFDAYFSMDAKMEHAFTTWARMTSDGGSLDIIGLVPRFRVELEGQIFDQETGLPIQTDFEIQVVKKGHQYLKSDENGNYKTAIRDYGVLLYFIDVEGYESHMDTLLIPRTHNDTLLKYDVYIVKEKPEVSILGTVTDKLTGETVVSEITFKLLSHEDIETNSLKNTGFYESHLHDVGHWVMVVECEGYHTHTEEFVIHSGELLIEIEKNIELTPKDKDIILSGFVVDEKTDKPIPSVVTYESPSGKTGEVTCDEEGSYETVLPEPGTYIMRASHEGYLNKETTVTVEIPETDDHFNKDIKLTAIEIGAKVRIDHIYFDFNKSTLREESNAELDRVVHFMNENPKIEIELSGHTDNRGSDDYNQKLSQDRSNAVMAYLIGNGVDASRMTSVGYGESQPEVANDTDGNRQINRRVQFVITKK
jgi:OOP family OmpA-OmpF porin